MITYPKIQTLYDRDPATHKVIPGKFRWPEFEIPNEWIITEKVDGTNIRVGYKDGVVEFAGRTDKAQIPAHLLASLKGVFDPDKMAAALPDGAEVVLFGEGYGHKIQDGGEYVVGDSVGFALFDVWIGGWWLEPENIEDIAAKLYVQTVPYHNRLPFDHIPTTAVELADVCTPADSCLSLASAADLNDIFADGRLSLVSAAVGKAKRSEGIVARTSPMLFTRHGERLIWKLKFRDFADNPK